MTNPSTIPKVLWLLFTHRVLGNPSTSAQVAAVPLERWQYGTKFHIPVHLDQLEEYTNSSIVFDSRGNKIL